MVKKIYTDKMQLGEIISYRGWRYSLWDSFIVSAYHIFKWPHKEIVSAGELDFFTNEGLYSFKTKELMLEQLCPEFFLLGTIKIWGDVIEHELGYRSQFAAVNSFYCFTNINLNSHYEKHITALAKLYNCEVEFDSERRPHVW